MDNLRITLIRFFIIILIIHTLANTVLAQENETIASPQQGIGITTANTSFSELSQNNGEDIIIESQRNLDRSLNILNIVASLLGVLVGLLTLIIALVGGLGFFEIRKWHEARKNIDKDIEIIKDTRNKAEHEFELLRKKIEKYPNPPLEEKPSEEIMKNLDEFASKFELLEMLGATLKSEDYFSRATDLYFKGKYELAIKAIEKAIELKPDYADAWYNKGVALKDLGRYDEALKANEKAIELKPDSAGAWYNKGAILSNLGRYDEALKANEKAIELKPENADAWYNKGVVLSNLGRYDEALKASERAIELEPDYVNAWNNKGAVLSNLGRYDEALKAIEKVIELEPENADVWNNKGVVLNDLGRYDEALKANEKAFELKPENADAWYNRACIFSNKDDKENALSCLRQAIDINITIKEKAKKDKDFEKLWVDESFKRMIE